MPPPAKSNLHTLYTKHAGELETFARKRVGDSNSRDVVHDAYLRLINYADTTQIDNPRAYLYRVTANVANDLNTRENANTACAAPDVDPDTLHSPHPGPDKILQARKNLQRCMSALEELPEIYRHVFLLHRVDGMTQGEVALALGIPKRTVERYISHALAHCLNSLQA